MQQQSTTKITKKNMSFKPTKFDDQVNVSDKNQGSQFVKLSLKLALLAVASYLIFVTVFLFCGSS